VNAIVRAPWRWVVQSGAAAVLNTFVLEKARAFWASLPRAKDVVRSGWRWRWRWSNTIVGAKAPILCSILVFCVAVAMLTPRPVVRHVHNSAARIHLSLPLKLWSASRRLCPATLGLSGINRRLRRLAAVAARTRQLARLVFPSTDFVDIFVALRIRGGSVLPCVACWIRAGSVVAILAGHVALKGSPWLLLEGWLMPNKCGSYWVGVVKCCIRKSFALPGAHGTARLPKFGQVPTLALSGYASARSVSLRRWLLLFRVAMHGGFLLGFGNFLEQRSLTTSCTQLARSIIQRFANHVLFGSGPN